MTPLDLSRTPPRSGRERLAGITFLPRTIDKMRAALPGGNLGLYKIPGISERLCEALGIAEAGLFERVSAAASEEEVGTWVRERAGEQLIGEWNAVAPNPIRDAEHRADLERRYPVLREHPEITTILDMLDADDRLNIVTR